MDRILHQESSWFVHFFFEKAALQNDYNLCVTWCPAAGLGPKETKYLAVKSWEVPLKETR